MSARRLRAAPRPTGALIAIFSPRAWVTPSWVVAQMVAEPYVAASLRTAQRVLGLRLDVESRALQSCLNDGLAGHLIEVAACAGFYDKLRAHGVIPTLVTGHSVGIYTALAATRCMALETLLVFLAEEIERFQATGGILAMVLNVPVVEVEQECDRIGEIWISAYNGERLCTVSGTRSAMARIETWVERRDGKLRRCEGFGPHHSPMIRPLKSVMQCETGSAVGGAPDVPIAFPLPLLRVESTRAGVVEASIEQLMTPVHWAEMVTTLLAPDEAVAVEIGTGNVIHKLFQAKPQERLKLRSLGDCLAAAPRLAGPGVVLEKT